MTEHEEAVSKLLKEWKQKPDLLITLEMLKSALKPLVDHQLSQYVFQDLGVREIDIREAADQLLVEALQTYDDSKGDLNSWVLTTLKGLDAVVQDLQDKYDPLRKAQKVG